MTSHEVDLNELALALAHWLEAAQAIPEDTEKRLAALEEARVRLARSRQGSLEPA